MVRQPYQNALWSARRLINPLHSVVLDMDYSSTTVGPNNHHSALLARVPMCSIGYGIYGLWQEDHSKINDGKAKSDHVVEHGRKTIDRQLVPLA